MLTIKGSVPTTPPGVENSAFRLLIDTSSTFSISMQGNFDIDYVHHIQRMNDSLDIAINNSYFFTDNSFTTDFTLDVRYKNWLLDIQETIPFFVQGGVSPYITPPSPTTNPPLPTARVETLELSWANSTFDTTARVQPFIGVGIGRMYNINHLVSARIILRSLGLSTSDEIVHEAHAYLRKRNNTCMP